MPFPNENCVMGVEGCNCRVTGVEVDRSPTIWRPSRSRRRTATRVTGLNTPSGTITMRSDYGAAAPVRPDPMTYTDEAYTYSPEQIRALTGRPNPWLGVFNVQDRFTPAALLKKPYRTVGAVEQRDWKVAWAKLWRQVGEAHEAKIFCKEVTYNNGELVIGSGTSAYVQR